MIDKIKKETLAEQAYYSIKQNLLSGAYREGCLIPSENQLSKMLCVSRVVVRKALNMLREEKIIVTFQGKGSFLANPENFKEKNLSGKGIDFDAFSEIMEYRACIERAAVIKAVKVADDKDLCALTAKVDAMRKAKDDYDAFNLADYDFHLQILKCARNGLFLSAIQGNKDKIISCLGAMNGLNDSRKWAIDLHQSIADALIQRDAKGALDLLQNNGEYNAARMKELYKN